MNAAGRRWLTIAEVVAVAGLVLTGLGLWQHWQERASDEAQRTAERRNEAVATLTATAADGGGRLDLLDPSHPVQRIDLVFPTALGLGAQTGVSPPRIEADWFDKPLLKADKGDDDHSGRLPVLVTSIWWEGTTRHADRAIYEVSWRTDKRLLRGRALRLEGASLAERGGDQRRIDQLWAAEAK